MSKSRSKSPQEAPALCVHCEQPLRNKRVHVYMQSGELAHFDCVSQPSEAETDALLVARQQVPPKRFAYQTTVD